MRKWSRHSRKTRHTKTKHATKAQPSTATRPRTDVFGGGPIAKSLDQLAEGPDRGGVVGDVEVEDLAAIVPEDDEDEEEPERER